LWQRPNSFLEGSEESPGSGIDEIKGILVEPPSRGSLWRLEI